MTAGISKQRNRGQSGLHPNNPEGSWSQGQKMLHPNQGSFCIACEAWSGSLGLEPTPELFVQHLVLVFKEVRRVLKPNGTLWLNLGDTYWAGGGTTEHGQSPEPYADKSTLATRPTEGQARRPIKPRKHPYLRPKDLIGIPWMSAFALRADGWYLRNEIIWHKESTMPESVVDRCTRSHEQIFLFSKNPDYFYDQDAIREPHTEESQARIQRGHHKKGHKWETGPGDQTISNDLTQALHPKGRNKRTVWTVNPKPYKGAHFAAWPPDLVSPMIKAGSKVGDTVLDPFSGSATTGMVALQLNRNYIGTELNSDYLDLAKRRILGLDPLSNTLEDNCIEELFGDCL
jgi:DNA modification methylase